LEGYGLAVTSGNEKMISPHSAGPCAPTGLVVVSAAC
jgi:hypothetical protein